MLSINNTYIFEPSHICSGGEDMRLAMNVAIAATAIALMVSAYDALEKPVQDSDLALMALVAGAYLAAKAETPEAESAVTVSSETAQDADAQGLMEKLLDSLI